jgi:hypothetical protein
MVGDDKPGAGVQMMRGPGPQVPKMSKAPETNMAARARITFLMVVLLRGARTKKSQSSGC